MIIISSSSYSVCFTKSKMWIVFFFKEKTNSLQVGSSIEKLQSYTKIAFYTNGLNIRSFEVIKEIFIELLYHDYKIFNFILWLRGIHILIINWIDNNDIQWHKKVDYICWAYNLKSILHFVQSIFKILST